MKKEKMNNPYSWDKINGNQYWSICDILNDPDDNDMDKSAKICCVIEHMAFDDFYNLPINDATRKINSLSFLNSFSLIKHYHPNYIQLGEYKCKVIQGSELNVAQFIDYQNFISQPFRDNYYKILSVFLIPEGHNYNDGYDIIEIQEFIREMTWREVQSLLGFLLIRYVKLLLRSLTYLIKQTKKMRGAEKKEMEEKINQLNQKIGDLMHFHISH